MISSFLSGARLLRACAFASLLVAALPFARACVTATAGGAWQDTAFASQTGAFTVAFDATPSASPTNSVIGLSDGAQTAYTGYACIVRFNTAGDIDARNGGAYAAASAIPYTANATYHVRMVVDIGAHTYSVYVTPPGGSEQVVGSGYAFRSEQASVAALSSYGVYVDGASGGSGTDTVCNFALSLPAAAVPVFSPAPGSYSSTQSVAISSSTSGASIRYTTDGSTPSETAGTLYTGPVSISATTTLNAIAYASGFSDSAVTSGTYTISTGGGSLSGSSGDGFHALAMSSAQSGTFTATCDATPSASPENTVVGLANGAPTAYTAFSCLVRFNPSGFIDAYNSTGYSAAASIPYAGNTAYHFRFVVNVPGQTYSVYVTPAGGSEQAVGLNYGFRAAQSSLDTWGLCVNASPAGCSVTASNFAVTASAGTVSAPVFSPSPGSYGSPVSVTIMSGTSGASIRYTTDGSTPTETAGTVYSGAVSIGATTTLKAVAYESGMTTSAVTSGTYTIGQSGVTTSGTVSFHLLLGVSSSQDSLTLTGDNYTDLIMSNCIAGVMCGHLIREYYPGIQFNQDYQFGTIFGQLLQENISTQLYTSGSNLIDPSPDQQAVMGAGQGGPYQINNYAIDMVSGSYQPQGHSLINYIAVQKNIGYTMATAANQYSQPTPPSFNNKYYGPMLCAFFHYNDLVALNIIGKGPGGWTTPWQPAFDQAMANFVNLPNAFLDVILNVGYNQGFYGTLEPHYCQLGATATPSTVASVNSYSSTWGSSDTYQQYPYQVHYYLDQIYDNPIPTSSPSNTVTPNNHVAFSMSQLGAVFSNVAQTLSYSDGTQAAQFFTASQAQSAFNAGLSQQGVSASATLDYSRAGDRAVIHAVLDAALSQLESTSGMHFNATTNSQL